MHGMTPPNWPGPKTGSVTVVAGALDPIIGLGGGGVESQPEAAVGLMVSGSFLHNGTMAMFQAAGLNAERRIPRTAGVVRKSVWLQVQTDPVPWPFKTSRQECPGCARSSQSRNMSRSFGARFGKAR